MRRHIECADPQNVPFAFDNVPGIGYTETDSPLWAGAKAFFGSLGDSLYAFGIRLAFGFVNEELYDAQINAEGERLYNVAKNLGYSDKSIARGDGLIQAALGEWTGMNAAAESIAGYDLGENRLLDGMERVQKGAIGTAGAAFSLAAGVSLGSKLAPKLSKSKPPAATPVGCFLAGTPVSLYRAENNLQRELVAIESVRKGDIIWASDPRTGKWEPKTVLESLTHAFVGDIITVQYEGGVFETTGGHPIWVKSGESLDKRPQAEHIYDDEHEMLPRGRWVSGRDLRVGDIFETRSGDSVQILDVKSRTETTTVYNLTVDDFHTYAVGEFEVLVHNKAAVRIVQSGGHTLSEGAARQIIKYNDLDPRTYNRRELGRLLEELKHDLALPPNFHGKIGIDGSYYGPNGNYLGNFLE